MRTRHHTDRASEPGPGGESARSARADVLGLELALARLQDILHSMAEGVLVVDPLGEIVTANEAACRFLCLEPEPCGRDLLACLPVTEREGVRRVLERVAAGQRVERIPALELGGVTCELSVTPLRRADQDGEPRTDADLPGGCVLILHDVTEAMALQHMKDEFLSSVSHELRTPLTSIRSYAEILLHMTPEDEKTWREFLGIVNVEAERLTRLVNEVLDLAKMEAGEMAFSFESLDVGSLLSAVNAVFAPSLEKKGLKLSIDCPSLLPAVWADHDRLHQVLTNLIGNAVKFVPEGGLLHVSVHREEGTPFLHFCIEDDGVGIAESQRDQIFEKFKQGGDGLIDKPRGTGLGLPLCRQMLHVMGGEIWCDASERLGGAAFHFRVPVSHEAARRW